jgi:hypothetical protein
MAAQTGFLDQSLLRLSSTDDLSVRDATQSILVLGGTGSGKTSGGGKAIREALLLSGAGGIVLVAKPEEAALWRADCARTGRTESLLEWNGENAGYNFIAAELARQGVAGLNAVIELVMRVLEVARAASSAPGRAGDAFWDDTVRQILRNSIPVLFAATGTVRIADILRFVRSAPTSPDEMRDPAWQKEAFFCEMFLTAAERLRAGPVAGFDQETGERATSYWRSDYTRMDGKLRGNVLVSLTTSLDRFNHGWLKDAFCGRTNIAPELCFHGVIILLNMPALTKNEDGIVAQQIFKLAFQRAVLTRNALSPAQQQRLVFCYADECQYFINSGDAEFLSTSRGSRCCTVYLSQSLPTFYAKMGGDNARDRVHHLLGNFGTKVFHSLGGCAETAEWAAKTIGRGLHWRESYNQSEGTSAQFGMNMGEGTNWGSNSGHGGSSSYSHGPGGSSYGGGSSWNVGSSQGGSDQWGRNRGSGSNSGESWGQSQQMDYLIEPGQFSRMLKTGGPANGNRVSAIWYQAGRRFSASGGNALLVEFAQ